MVDLPEDSLADLLGGKMVGPAKTPPATYQPTSFDEPCRKCRGSGQFVGWSGRSFGPCFACKGTGKLSFKTAPAARAKNREGAAARKVKREADAMETLRLEHAEVHAWMLEAAPTFPFAAEMLETIRKFGALTDRQMAACYKCVEGRKRARAEAETRKAAAPEVNVSAIEAAFAKASVHLKRPKLHLDGFVIKHAAPTSKNAGALYVTEGGEYLGKIAGGKFLAVRSCGDDRQAKVVAAAADPQAATIRYGRLTGNCGCCLRPLTNAESVARGIGPICAERFGW